ncbi:MAG: SulP family inorganic anion transporter [Chloroflexota bacterium]|nr:SulP family inorganic anion transporter [Chloroflexota bacterium]MDE2941574.1 SulP family inorganic anion transporter [Chloroflexota bacterium]MDE3268055.1 SulP family inorganic anion transporter [Chloroflexota bacterium]
MNIKRRIDAALPRQFNYGLANLRGDVLGGITAGSISLPTAMGYGLISGLGPVAGLYGALAVSLFAGVFGGTRGMTSGPNILVTLTMAVVVAEYATSIEEAISVAILAGLIQIGFGLLGLGRYVAYVPFALTAGFFTAFGFLMILKQVLLGLGASPAGTAADSIGAIPSAIADVHVEALALTTFCVVLGVLWRGRLLRIAPSPFVVLVVGTIVGVSLLRNAPTIEEIPTGLPTPQLPDISLDFVIRVMQPAFAMALLSSVSTLLVSLQLDAITGSLHRPNREVIAQGLGNMAAGLIGGSPGGVAPGSFANAFSGGRSPVAGVTVAVLFLLVILVLAPVAERIPFAVLAGILIVNGWNIIDWRFIKGIHRIPPRFSFVMVLTILLVLFVDINLAIIVGLVVAALTGARRIEPLEVGSMISTPVLDTVILGDDDQQESIDPYQARTGLVIFPDRVTVASAREVSRILRTDIRGHQVVVFDMSRTQYVDDTAAVAIGGLIRIAMAARTRTLIVSGLNVDVTDTLNSLRVLDSVPRDSIVSDMEAAKEIIRPILREQ